MEEAARRIHDAWGVVHNPHEVEVHTNHEDQFDDIVHAHDKKHDAYKVLEAHGHRDEERNDKVLLDEVWEEEVLCNLFRSQHI
jgi:hypothetical protein